MNIKMNHLGKMRLTRNLVAVAAVLIGGAAGAEGITAAGWEERSLFSPTTARIRDERRGHITIYQGLTDVTVEKAMDQQFARIESMMFVGTRVTDDEGGPAIDPDSGGADVEDDGCGD